MARALRAPQTLVRRVLDRVVWPWWVRLQGVKSGLGLRLVGCPAVRIEPGGRIELGRGVRLFSRPDSNPLGLKAPCMLQLVEPGAQIRIGDDSALSGTVICAALEVELGQRVCMGANSMIVDTDFHPLSAAARREHPTRGRRSRAVRLADDVFVGAGAMILKGSTLGEGCVVGAGAVVSGVFPARAVVAGNPARVIKQLEA
jgi:acetyltransferase-like isoleucine patch superfamily enzyme